MGSVQTDHSVAFCFLKYKHIYNGGTVTLTLQKLIIIKKEKSIHKETKGSSALAHGCRGLTGCLVLYNIR